MPGAAEWRLTWGTHTFTADDLIGADLAQLAMLVGNTWDDMTPVRSPMHLMSVLAVVVARFTGSDPATVLTELRTAKATALADALTIEE